MEAALFAPSTPASTPAPADVSTHARWVGRVLSALPILFLTMDGLVKFMNAPEVAEAHVHLGLPVELAPVLGVIELACVALYAVPRTAPIGAVLLSGWLGGAVLAHLRIGDALATHTLFPLYFGAFVWAGLFLRDARVRALVAPTR